MNLSKLLCYVLISYYFNFNLCATASPSLFEKYKNEYFIETGTYEGEGILMALNAGFPQVYSIELSPTLHAFCCERFISDSNVHILLGDSTNILPILLKHIDAPATFWLDGHYSGGSTSKGSQNTPILFELESIKNHPIHTHTILIDDVRCFGTDQFDFIGINEIVLKILEINQDYIISFEDGHQENDILVAKVP